MVAISILLAALVLAYAASYVVTPLVFSMLRLAHKAAARSRVLETSVGVTTELHAPEQPLISIAPRQHFPVFGAATAATATCGAFLLLGNTTVSRSPIATFNELEVVAFLPEFLAAGRRTNHPTMVGNMISPRYRTVSSISVLQPGNYDEGPIDVPHGGFISLYTPQARAR